MTLKLRLSDDMKAAMKGGDKQRLAAIRLINAAVKQREVDERIELDDEQIVAVLGKMVKQHQDSIEQYRKGERPDLVEKEAFELEIIASYLPPQLPDEELAALIEQAITASGAQSIKDMGKVMAELKPKVQGRADMGVVSARIRSRLGS